MNCRKLYFGVITFFLLLVLQAFIPSNAAQAATPIMGQTQAAKDQMVKYFNQYFLSQGKKPTYPYANTNVPTIDAFVSTTIDEANYEGVRAEVAFALMMKETGFLQFGGDVNVNQYNFGGIGATGGGVPGYSFPDPVIGIRAVVQHLKAYASTDPLKQPCVDPRYNNVVPLGKAPYAENLGNGNWATDPNYGADLVNRINFIESIPALRMWVDAPVKGSTIRGTSALISGWALDAPGPVTIQVFKQDGTPITGTPKYGLSRPDVDQVYPGYPNGATSGFNYTFDTRQLPNGVQTIVVKVTGSSGSTLSWNIQVNVDNTTRMWVDAPVKDSTIRGTATIAGWALDPSGSPKIQVFKQDGTPIAGTLTTGLSRPDVNQVYPGYPNGATSGFSFTFDSTQFPNDGAQTIIVKVTGSSGAPLSWSIQVTLDNIPMYIDSPLSGSAFKRNQTVTISGWALNKSGVSKIMVQYADGTPLPGTPTLGISRPDVNQVYPGYPNGATSGFSFTFDSNELKSGPNTLKIIAVGNNGTTDYELITLRIRYIVIDPGHGGSDPGAVANGVQEKDVNLAVALKLRDILNSQGIDVLMTRDSDVYVGLTDRANISNASGGDAFISIHANSGSSSAAYVLGTYFDINSGYAVGTTSYDPIAASNWPLSKDLAEKVAYSLGSATGQTVYIQSHSYVVLKYNHLPATLVELGFLSNPNWAPKLIDPNWQYNAAEAIAKGIESWLNSH